MATDIKRDDIGDALTEWSKQLEKQVTGMSQADKEDVVMQGALVFEKHLREETRNKHYSSHNDPVFGHAADNISMYKPADGSMSDANTNFTSYIVGWKHHYHAMNMLRANDGTKRQVGDNFITNLQSSGKIRQEILEAEQQRYKQLLNRGD